MNRVYTNLGIGTFWLFVAGGMYITKMANAASVAVLVIVGIMFYWAAFKMFKNPQIALKNKNKKNLIQKMTDPGYKNTYKKKK